MSLQLNYIFLALPIVLQLVLVFACEVCKKYQSSVQQCSVLTHDNVIAGRTEEHYLSQQTNYVVNIQTTSKLNKNSLPSYKNAQFYENVSNSTSTSTPPPPYEVAILHT